MLIHMKENTDDEGCRLLKQKSTENPVHYRVFRTFAFWSKSTH
ncbi:hypothetical protein SAMN05216191_11388 [Paenibacillus jilunlii]|uniref:Uncharacterized protein n=1 Tax=Paenibacillus jilunlii TaxID=682956 RepID=A0A1G9TKT6_9BACL|nr:hypothetical protein SAMN05216191_11388 [Paenibacillus jilunlii]